MRVSKLDRRGNILPGDIIVAIDEQPVDSVAMLLSRLDQCLTYRVNGTDSGAKWNPQRTLRRQQYGDRQFILLEHRLTVRGRLSLRRSG